MNRAEPGQLKIFFGYAEGTGKTRTMLEEARSAKNQGIDVLVGSVSPDIPVQMPGLLEGLEQIETDQTGEPDFDRIITRDPELVLIDELAHTNGENSRYRNRYQYVAELLNHGIDVYTTLNVGNLESLHDIVVSITGIAVWEHIPDEIFDHASQVEFVDVEPRELLEHLKGSCLLCGRWLSGDARTGREKYLTSCMRQTVFIRRNIFWYVSHPRLPMKKLSAQQQKWRGPLTAGLPVCL